MSRNVKPQVLPAWEQFPLQGNNSTDDVLNAFRIRTRDNMGRSSHLPYELLKALRIGPYRTRPEPEGVRVVGWQPLKSEDDGIGHAVGDDYNPFDA